VIRTFSRSIGLHEALARAGLFELWGEPCELGQVFVDEAHFRRKVVVVEVAGEVSAGVAYGKSVKPIGLSDGPPG
jgi:hypothetical protein